LEDVAVLNRFSNFALLLQGSLSGSGVEERGGEEGGGGEEVGSGDEAPERMPAADDVAGLARRYLLRWPMECRESITGTYKTDGQLTSFYKPDSGYRVMRDHWPHVVKRMARRSILMIVALRICSSQILAGPAGR
jgi:hypothetical protein